MRVRGSSDVVLGLPHGKEKHTADLAYERIRKMISQ